MKAIPNISYPAVALFAFACVVLSPTARAVCQQGCDVNHNTALGEGALVGNTTGNLNTATVFFALTNNTIGIGNTAIGSSALFYNTTGSFNTATGDNSLAFNSTGATTRPLVLMRFIARQATITLQLASSLVTI